MASQTNSNKIHIVLGLGSSGFNAAKLLKSENKNVLVLENNSNEKLITISNKLKSSGIEVILLNEPLNINHFTPWIGRISSIIVSPGIDWEHTALKALRSRNIKMLGEVELAWERLNHIKSIGITGTNGKTTVTNMLNHVLKLNYINADMGGNVGKALSEIALESRHKNLNWLVLELSSYQIEGSPKIAPTIGIWTTFTPDHLERHHNIETYFQIKRSLLEKSSIRIYNSDDKYLSEKRNDLPQGIWVGINKQSSYLHHPKFWINHKGYIYEDQTQLFHSSILKIPGKHNLQNLLLVTAAAREIGIEHSLIAKSIDSFEGIPHRLEYLGEMEKISFYNDSKATNFDSSIIGLKSVPKPSILIAGGKQKIGACLNWIEQLKHSTNAIVLFGVDGIELKNLIELSSYKGEIVLKQTLEEATKASIEIAKKINSKSILLSPACASFDQYKNFEERGNHFKKIVKEYGIVK